VAVDLNHQLAQTPFVMLSYQTHGLLGTPTLIWYGILPDSAGINTLLRSAPFGNFPLKWFTPITRADRKRASGLAGSDEALDISTQMLCQKAELEDGTKAFASADAVKLQRELPESVLNDLELFLFGLAQATPLEDAKNG
jgi:hypothetical protein